MRYCTSGATLSCCQGSNPVALQDAFCGWWFNVGRPAEDAATDINVPLCGK